MVSTGCKELDSKDWYYRFDETTGWADIQFKRKTAAADACVNDRLRKLGAGKNFECDLNWAAV